MTDPELRRAIGQLYWPGWLSLGRPDLSAVIAENGGDGWRIGPKEGVHYYGPYPRVRTWDWVRDYDWPPPPPA